jgi:GPH family glycoside/pentoside/hexuronide:cation symporter
MMLDRLSRKTKLMYGSGDTGFSLTSTIIGAYFLIFLTDVVGLSPGTAAIVLFVGHTWDYVNDPIFGHLSDRTRTRWGRRRPYLLFGALPYALAFTLLWWRPPWQGTLALVAYYAVAYVAYEAAATLVYMPYFALTPELTSDYDERTSLTTYRMFFSILGSLVAFTVPLMIIGSFQPVNDSRVLLMGAVFAIASALPLLLAFFGTREREAYAQQKRPSLGQSLRAAAKNRPFVFGLVIYLLTWLAVGVVQTTLIYFIKYAVRREPESEVIMATIFVTAILALPMWEWASRRWSKRWAYAGGIAFWAVVQIALITLNPASGLPLILTMCVLAGVGVSAAHVLPWSILPDAIEWGELQTGERHEGTFYSLVTLADKVARSLMIPAVGLLLEWTGYVANADAQPASALLGIRLVIGPLPAILLCAGILFAVLYPLGRQEYTQVVQDLTRRRAVPGEEVP